MFLCAAILYTYLLASHFLTSYLRSDIVPGRAARPLHLSHFYTAVVLRGFRPKFRTSILGLEKVDPGEADD